MSGIQRNLDTIERERIHNQLRRDFTYSHLQLLFELIVTLGGIEYLKDFLWDLRLTLKELSLSEFKRAIEREIAIKAHYEGKSRNRGGRRSKIQPLFVALQDWHERAPDSGYYESTAVRFAKQYGSHAAPEVRLSLTSQWRLNKKLQAAGMDPIPWRTYQGVFSNE